MKRRIAKKVLKKDRLWDRTNGKKGIFYRTSTHVTACKVAYNYQFQELLKAVKRLQSQSDEELAS